MKLFKSGHVHSDSEKLSIEILLKQKHNENLLTLIENQMMEMEARQESEQPFLEMKASRALLTSDMRKMKRTIAN